MTVHDGTDMPRGRASTLNAGMRRRLPAVVALVVVVSGLAPAPSASAVAGPGQACTGSQWVGSWQAAPGHDRHPGVALHTLRVIVAPHRGGDRLRVRLTNRFGSGPVTFEKVFIGRSAEGGAVVPGTNTPVTFGGSRSATVLAGDDLASDPVSLSFGAFQDLAVGMYVRAPTGTATAHFDGHQISYSAVGDVAADETGVPFAMPTQAWWFLSGVDVVAPKRVGAVVALGDSITDGFQSVQNGSYLATLNQNERYPDYLARRIIRAGLPYSVLNAGISGNRLLTDAEGQGALLGFGPSALNRLDADVLRQAGVSDVILLEGTNDIGGGATAAQVIDGLRQLVRRMHDAGLNVVLGTLLPANGSDRHSTPEQIAGLEEVNRWIRTSGVADAVADFNVALRDENDLTRLDPAYDSGDALHPNSAGYQSMAAAIDLDALDGPPCRRGVAAGSNKSAPFAARSLLISPSSNTPCFSSDYLTAFRACAFSFRDLLG